MKLELKNTSFRIVYGRALGSVLKTLVLASIVLAFELFTGIHQEVISYIRDISVSDTSLPQPAVLTKSHLVRRRRNKKAKLYFIMSGNDTHHMEWTSQNLLTRGEIKYCVVTLTMVKIVTLMQCQPMLQMLHNTFYKK